VEGHAEANAADERRRLARVHARWRKVQGFRADLVWRGDSPTLCVSSIGLLVGIAAIPVLQSLDASLWMRAESPVSGQRGPLPADVAAGLALVAACLLQGALLDRFLARQTLGEPSVRALVRRSRLLLASVPLLGFFVVPAWRRLLEARRPAWAFLSEPPRPRCELPMEGRQGCRACKGGPCIGARRAKTRAALRRRLDAASSGLASTRVLVSVYLAEVLVLIFVAQRLAAHGSRVVAWTMSAVFHVASSLGMAAHFVGRARPGDLLRRAGMPALGLLALAWLPPIPWFGFAGLGVYALIDAEGRETTLTHRIHARRQATERLAEWRALQHRLRRAWLAAPWWRRVLASRRGTISASADLGTADAHLLDLARARTLSLPLEAAWLAWTCLRLAQWRPWQGGALPATHGAIAVLTASSLVLGLCGLALVAGDFLSRLLQETSAPSAFGQQSWAHAFAFTELGFAAGLCLGEAIDSRNAPRVATVAALACLAGLLVLASPIALEILGPVPPLFRRSLRQEMPLLLLCPLLLAASMRFSRATAASLASDWRVLQQLVLLAPLLGMVPALRHLDWLLRPYPARRMFSRELPVRVRATLAFFTFSGLLPLGGLAVPFWIVLRRRRGWPPTPGRPEPWT